MASKPKIGKKFKILPTEEITAQAKIRNSKSVIEKSVQVKLHTVILAKMKFILIVKYYFLKLELLDYSELLLGCLGPMD